MDETILPTLFQLTWFLLVVLVIVAILTSDSLIRLEYETRREQWDKDRRPVGMLWRPPGTSFFQSIPMASRFGQSLPLLWMFKTPGWIRDYPEAIRLLRRLRVLEGIGFLLIALWFGMFAFGLL